MSTVPCFQGTQIQKTPNIIKQAENYHRIMMLVWIIQLLFVRFLEQVSDKSCNGLKSTVVVSAYALEVVTSCQVLVMFCFSSFSGVMPSFLLMSASCFSLAASTWDRVWISSSTCTQSNVLRCLNVHVMFLSLSSLPQFI